MSVIGIPSPLRQVRGRRGSEICLSFPVLYCEMPAARGVETPIGDNRHAVGSGAA